MCPRLFAQDSRANQAQPRHTDRCGRKTKGEGRRAPFSVSYYIVARKRIRSSGTSAACRSENRVFAFFSAVLPETPSCLSVLVTAFRKVELIIYTMHKEPEHPHPKTLRRSHSLIACRTLCCMQKQSAEFQNHLNSRILNRIPPQGHKREICPLTGGQFIPQHSEKSEESWKRKN